VTKKNKIEKLKIKKLKKKKKRIYLNSGQARGK